MLWTIIGILLAIWLLGFLFKIGGAIIHVFLILAAIMLVYNIIKNRVSRR